MALHPKATFNFALVFATVMAMIWLFSDIVLYILVSLVISSLLRPVTDYIDSLEFLGIKVPRALAVLVSFALLAVVPVLFILMFVPLILDQITVLQGIRLDQVVVGLQEPILKVENFILSNFRSEREAGFLMKEINDTLISIVESIQIGTLLNYILQFTGTIFIYVLAVSFITFFLLYEKGILRRSLLALIPNAYFEVGITTINKIEKLLSNYLVGLLFQIAIMFTIIALGLTLSGTKYALTIATFAAIVNLIPYLGPVIGFLFGIVVVISTKSTDNEFNHYLFLVIKALPVFAIAQLIDNILLQPIIFSKSVKAHPLEIFIVIFAGAAIAGGLGMIAAIPTYTILRVSYLELSESYQQYYIFKKGKNSAG